MRKKIFSVFILSVFCFLSITSLCQAGFKLRWVEINVVLDKDGKAQITYAVRWTCQNADLHGFYFEGFVGSPVFDYENACAVDEKGNRYSLEIKKLSLKKYDIVLAEGKAFNNGEITYFFRYANDLQTSGNLTQTDSDFGRLAVFNWAPVQWDEDLEHETVIVQYPISLPLQSVSEEWQS